jgi:hypothetical protein
MSGIGALAHYGAATRNQLFTAYAQQDPAATTSVTTDLGTLTWQYVASGLPGVSGSVGTLPSGAYYVGLDASGGGVVTVTPEPATLTLLAAGMACVLACACRKRR